MIILRKVKCIQTNDPQVHVEERKVCTVTAVAKILRAHADQLLENHERMGNTTVTVRQLVWGLSVIYGHTPVYGAPRYTFFMKAKCPLCLSTTLGSFRSFFENSRRYSQVKMHHWYQWHRCQTMRTISDCLHLQWTFIYLCINSTTQRCPN